MCDADFIGELLDWYDRHARELPWRVGPPRAARGVRPDPYRVWLSEIMLQQTTVAAVRAYFEAFTAPLADGRALAAAEDAEVMAAWAGLGYYARARNLLKCARVVVGATWRAFPDTRDGLLALPGIGPYTAAAIAAIAFDRPETVVDGNVERVMARLHAVETPLPAAKPRPDAAGGGADAGDAARRLCAGGDGSGRDDLHAAHPGLRHLPVARPCAGRARRASPPDLPAKTPKKAKPVRHGIAYVARRPDGAWLLETRPDTGLLGGMLGWPGSGWAEAPANPAAGRRLAGRRRGAPHLHAFPPRACGTVSRRKPTPRPVALARPGAVASQRPADQ